MLETYRKFRAIWPRKTSQHNAETVYENWRRAKKKHIKRKVGN
jgi:hypothetical protein